MPFRRSRIANSVSRTVATQSLWASGMIQDDIVPYHVLISDLGMRYQDLGRLTAKVAFVSGGASGIGRAIVERFVTEGAEVCFGDIDVAGGKVVAATGAAFIRQ